jgi:ADP-ribose pyrophosphatase YjhB (NUDIX family)
MSEDKPKPQKGPREWVLHPGEDKPRRTCPECNIFEYDNPKNVVGAVVVNDAGQILLCRRAINPRKGYWTLPAGFMELKETTEEGAAREADEEAEVKFKTDALLALYNVVEYGQVHIYYRAKMTSPHFAPSTSESLEVKLFDWKDIPWNELAFPTVKLALQFYDRTKHLSDFQPDQRTVTNQHMTQKPPAP